MSIAPERLTIGIGRKFTTEGVHPYDQMVWEKRDARINNWKDGTIAFEQLGVEFPVGWSLNATNIVTQKYFRGTPGTSERSDASLQPPPTLPSQPLPLHHRRCTQTREPSR